MTHHRYQKTNGGYIRIYKDVYSNNGRFTTASQEILERIKANAEQLEAIAQDKGITPEELKKELLNEGEDIED